MSLSQAFWQLGSFVSLGNSDVFWVLRTQVKEFLVFCLCDLGQERNIYHIERIGEQDQEDRLWKQTAWFNSECVTSDKYLLDPVSSSVKWDSEFCCEIAVRKLVCSQLTQARAKGTPTLSSLLCQASLRSRLWVETALVPLYLLCNLPRPSHHLSGQGCGLPSEPSLLPFPNPLPSLRAAPGPPSEQCREPSGARVRPLLCVCLAASFPPSPAQMGP